MLFIPQCKYYIFKFTLYNEYIYNKHRFVKRNLKVSCIMVYMYKLKLWAKLTNLIGLNLLFIQVLFYDAKQF